jgi:adenosylcobinamide-phosphate synthase
LDLTYIYPKNLAEFLCILILAIIFDFVYPYHRGLLYLIHPTHTAYTLAFILYKIFPKTKASGLIIWLIVVLSHISIYGVILYLTCKIHKILWLIAAIYIVKVSISLKLLINYVNSVKLCLQRGEITCAREAVSHIVRRDVSKLSEGYVASATLESLFESLVDGFTSPLLLYLLLGPLGALLQRVINTLDSALGYKEPNFKDVGWFSAKADTYINFIPARFTAFLIILLCPTIKGSMNRSWKIYLRDKNATQSKNAGHPMASASGCLSVRLEKICSYVLGSEYPLPTYRDIHKGLKLAIHVALTFLILVISIYYFVSDIILIN